MGQGGRVSPPDRARHLARDHRTPAVYNMEEMAAVDLPYPEADGKNLFLGTTRSGTTTCSPSGGTRRVDLKAFRQANGTRP